MERLLARLGESALESRPVEWLGRIRGGTKGVRGGVRISQYDRADFGNTTVRFPQYDRAVSAI